MATITTASRELFTRTPDEYCRDMNHMVEKCTEMETRTHVVDVTGVHVQPNENSLDMHCLFNNQPGFAQLNNNSFNHLLAESGGQRKTINALSPETAALALNELLDQRSVRQKNYRINILHQPTGPEVRALYSERYSRLPDVDFALHMQHLCHEFGYVPAGEVAGKRGGLPPVKPDCTGLYKGETGLFGFVANETAPIETSNDSALFSAFIFKNSETKDACAEVQHIFYEYICGNHICWNAKIFFSVKRRHIGDVDKVLSMATDAFVEAERMRTTERDKVFHHVTQAQRQSFADTRKKAQTRLENYLTKKQAANALEFLEHPRAYTANPLSIYGVHSAVTLYSQTMHNADDRFAIDQSAGRILSLVDA